MIFDGWGLALNSLTIGVTSFWLALFLIASLVSMNRETSYHFDATSRMRLLWCAVALPWLGAVASILLLLAPEILALRIDWITSLAHWHHAYTFNIISWHGAVLIAFTATFVIVSLTKLARAIRTGSRLSQLDYFSVSEQLEDGAMVIDSDKPHAFTAGLFNPRSYISSGLREQISARSLTVVQQHELAHLRRRDPLRKYLFSLLASFFPRSVEKQFNDALSLALEQLADDASSQAVNDRTLVSKTILEIARLERRDQGTVALSPVKCGFASNALEMRIRYLLDDEKGKPFPYLMFFASALILIALCTLSVDIIHHSVERLFSH
jgi:Zn-dependent protease with chaperone function